MIVSQFRTRYCWLAGILVVTWLVTACGAPPAPRDETSSQTSPSVMLEYRRSGGIAGWNDHVVIRTDGQVTVERKGGQAETFTLDPDELDALKKALADSHFFDLKSSYLPPREIPDAFHYSITYQEGGRRHTVETSDGAVPPELGPVLDQLNRILADH